MHWAPAVLVDWEPASVVADRSWDESVTPAGKVGEFSAPGAIDGEFSAPGANIGEVVDPLTDDVAAVEVVAAPVVGPVAEPVSLPVVAGLVAVVEAADVVDSAWDEDPAGDDAEVVLVCDSLPVALPVELDEPPELESSLNDHEPVSTPASILPSFPKRVGVKSSPP